MTTTSDQGIYQLIYRSRSAVIGSEATIESEVSSLLEKSVRNNARNGVTGALMFTASMFIQVLEGRCVDVERTFERICCDLRHFDVELLSFSSVPARTFDAWDMHRIQDDETSMDLFRSFQDMTSPEGNTAHAILQAVSLLGDLAGKKLAEPVSV